MNLNIASTTPNAVLSEIRDGWENDEWGSLEEEPAEEMEELNHHQNTSRSNSNSSSAANNNTESNISPIKNNINDMKINTNSKLMMDLRVESLDLVMSTKFKINSFNIIKSQKQ